MPCPLAAVASCISAVASLFGMLDPGIPNWVVAQAMCPSAETWPGVVNGSVTPVTCGACRNGARASSLRATGTPAAPPERVARAPNASRSAPPYSSP